MTTLDERLTFEMILEGLNDKVLKFLGLSLSDKEKLDAIIKAMQRDVLDRRVFARKILHHMKAIQDPDTPELEPLEAAQQRRERLVKMGSENLGDSARVAQITQEIKAVDAVIASNQATFDTLGESYQLALSNYRIALAALEHTQENGAAMLLAIKAHREALALRDQSRQSGSAPDTTFMDGLAQELKEASRALRSDDQLEADLDPENTFSISAELDQLEAQEADAKILAEIQAAAAAGSAASSTPGPSATTYQVSVKPQQ